MFKELNDAEMFETYKMGFKLWNNNKSLIDYIKECEEENINGRSYSFIQNNKVICSLLV